MANTKRKTILKEGRLLVILGLPYVLSILFSIFINIWTKIIYNNVFSNLSKFIIVVYKIDSFIYDHKRF